MRNTLLFVILLILTSLIISCSNSEQLTGELPNKSTGGVIICGVDYPCGQADDMFPENYGAQCKVEDADCEE